MPINGYFDIVFADDGDVTTIPDAVDPSGFVSMTQGYTSEYQSPSGTYPIERDKFNFLMNQVTSAIQYNQQGKAAPFITSSMNGGTPFSYSKYDRVLKDGLVYISLANSNTQTPPDTNWSTSLSVESGGTGLGTLTQYSVVTGNGTSAVNLVAPSPASGLALISQGSSAQPLFGTTAIAGGGTGQTTALAGFDALKQAATTSYTGVVELADDTEALSGSDGTRAVTSSGLASSKSLSTNGYMKLPGGLILQWGTVTESTSGTDYKNFPISFPTACRAVLVNLDASTPGGFGNNFGINVQVHSTSQFLWNAAGSFGGGGIGLFWAVGY